MSVFVDRVESLANDHPVIAVLLLLLMVGLATASIVKLQAPGLARQRQEESRKQEEFRVWCESKNGRVIWRSGAWNRPDYQDCIWPPK